MKCRIVATYYDAKKIFVLSDNLSKYKCGVFSVFGYKLI
nr:hypothetical protein [Escherichia coli]